MTPSALNRSPSWCSGLFVSYSEQEKHRLNPMSVRQYFFIGQHAVWHGGKTCYSKEDINNS
jgi:hypothetical protein